MMSSAWVCVSQSAGTHSDIAAVEQSTGPFAGLVVNTHGEMLAPMVTRDASGKPMKFVGAAWFDNKGSSVFIDVDTRGLPTRAFIGGYVLMYSNWDLTAETVDIAKVYVPGQHIEIFRGVKIPGASKLGAGSGTTTPLDAPTCFPACDTSAKNWGELIKLASLGIEVGVCGAEAAESFGIAAVPCAGALISTATTVTGDEKWVEDQEGAIYGLKAAGCGQDLAKGKVADCIATAIELFGEFLASYEKESTDAKGTLDIATTALGNPSQTGVVQQGTGLPMCSNDYVCSPGAYMPCYPDGVKQCDSNCQWGACPHFEPGCGTPPGGCQTGQIAAEFGDGCCTSTGGCTAGGEIFACNNLCNGWYEYAGTLYGPCSSGYDGHGGGSANPGFSACVDAAASAAVMACDPPPPP